MWPGLIAGFAAGLWLLTFVAQALWQHSSATALMPATADGVPSVLVSKVVDGDSLEVLVNGKRFRVRLYGIDAPEWDQPWGSHSRDALARLVDRERVILQLEDVDNYGRQVATVLLGEQNVNHEMIRTGNAWVYRRYNSDRSMVQQERQARDLQLGLWQDADPVPPWEWRRRKR